MNMRNKRKLMGCFQILLSTLFLYPNLCWSLQIQDYTLRPMPAYERDVLDDKIKSNNYTLDEETGLAIPDPHLKPFPSQYSQSYLEELHRRVVNRLKYAVLSFSGIREIFDSTLKDIRGRKREDPDGYTVPDWEGIGSEITDAAKVHIATIARNFAQLVKERSDKEKPVITMAMDTRHTGPAIADIVIRMLLCEGIDVRFSFITTISELMLWSKSIGADGWIYISASHNPRGHNGIKLGLVSKSSDGTSDTQILSENDGLLLRETIKRDLQDIKNTSKVIKVVNNVSLKNIRRVYENINNNRSESHKMYSNNSDTLVTGKDVFSKARRLKKKWSRQIRKKRLVIGLDPNGGARSKIEAEYWRSWGFDVIEYNGKPREDMVGALAPTQESMEELSKKMVEFNLSPERTEDGRTMIAAIRFDTDGDRKNCVFWDLREKRPIAPGVQVCFALDVIAKVMQDGIRERLNPDVLEDNREVVVVVNDATSTLLERLKDILGFKLRVTEVGEANVIEAAEEEKANGKTVVIIGEGSNGGAFTLQLKVREPRFTIGTILSFLLDKRLVKEYLKRMDREDLLNKKDFSIVDLINTLPPSATTDFFTEKHEGDRIGLAIPFKLFKDTVTNYLIKNPSKIGRLIETISKEFNNAIPSISGEFSYEIWNYERSRRLSEYAHRKRKRGSVKSDHSGGYRIEIYHTEISTGKKRLIGWLWFRPSATEFGVIRKGVSISHWILSKETQEMIHNLKAEMENMLNELLNEVELLSAVEFWKNISNYNKSEKDMFLESLTRHPGLIPPIEKALPKNERSRFLLECI